MSVIIDFYFNTYKIFKVQIPQELSEDDFDRRVEFCNIRMQHSDDDANFIYNIVFSDELTFMLNGSVNRHNCSYCSDTNPLWMMEGQKLLFGLAFYVTDSLEKILNCKK